MRSCVRVLVSLVGTRLHMLCVCVCVRVCELCATVFASWLLVFVGLRTYVYFDRDKLVHTPRTM